MEEVLHNLGFSDKEARVYIAFLAVGPASVQDIASKTGIQRATLYGVLESLKKRGVLRALYQSHRKVFSVASPDVLARTLADEKKRLEAQEVSLLTIMPMLQALEKQEQSQGERVMLGEGEYSIRNAWGDIGKRAEKAVMEVIVPSRGMQEAFFADRQSVIGYTSRIQVRRMYIAPRESPFMPRKDDTQEVRLYDTEAQFPLGTEWVLGEGFLVSIIHEPFPRVYWHEDSIFAGGIRGMFEVLWRASLTASDSIPLDKH